MFQRLTAGFSPNRSWDAVQERIERQRSLASNMAFVAMSNLGDEVVEVINQNIFELTTKLNHKY